MPSRLDSRLRGNDVLIAIPFKWRTAQVRVRRKTPFLGSNGQNHPKGAPAPLQALDFYRAPMGFDYLPALV